LERIDIPSIDLDVTQCPTVIHTFKYGKLAIFLDTSFGSCEDSLGRLKSRSAKLVEQIRQDANVEGPVLVDVKSRIESKTDLDVFQDAHRWFKKDVDFETLSPVDAVYITILSDLYFQMRDVTVCSELRNGDRSLLCFSQETLDNSVLVVFQVFENGRGLYEVALSGPSDQASRDQDATLRERWREFVRGVTASVVVEGLKLNTNDKK